MQSKTFQVPNIGCNGCVQAIKNELTQISGVQKVDGVVNSKTVTVEWGDPADWQQIVRALKDIDYAPAEA